MDVGIRERKVTTIRQNNRGDSTTFDHPGSNRKTSIFKGKTLDHRPAFAGFPFQGAKRRHSIFRPVLSAFRIPHSAHNRLLGLSSCQIGSLSNPVAQEPGADINTFSRTISFAWARDASPTDPRRRLDDDGERGPRISIVKPIATA